MYNRQIADIGLPTASLFPHHNTFLLFANHPRHGLCDKLRSGAKNNLDAVIADEDHPARADAVEAIFINRIALSHFQAQAGDAGPDGIDIL